MTKRRIAKLRLWSKWENELKPAELKLHDSMHANVAKVLKDKRLLLLEKLATEVGWPDVNLFKELRTGFKLTGYAPPSGVFKTDLRPSAFGKAQLMQDAKFLRPLLLGKVASPAYLDQYSEELFDITMKEAKEKIGWKDHTVWPK